MSRGLFVDNFAGGGGASEGIEQALGRPVDYALNHDPLALAMHKVNHPETVHLCENIRTARPERICGRADLDGLWMSPDCTFHSKARGGMPWRDPIRAHRSRGTAWTLIRWLKHKRPRVFFLENVEEMEYWAPLIKVGPREWIPDWERAGEEFEKFTNAARAFGYKLEFRRQRAMYYGAGTIRQRLFIIGRCDCEPIVWPDPSHGPGAQPFVTAADCIDWSLPCPSIFERKRPLADATLRRIARGVFKYVINAAEPFIVPVSHGGDARVHGIGEPLRTVTGSSRSTHALVTPMIVGAGGSEYAGKPRAGNEPMGTIVTENHRAIATAFLAKHYGGNESPGWPMERPMSTITTQDHHHLVTSHLVKFYGTSQHGAPVNAPLPTILAGGGHHVGEVRAFLVKYFGQGVAKDLREPMATLTTKHRIGLVMVHGHPYEIVDIGMRMLTARELFNAQGFPPDYVINPVVERVVRGKRVNAPMTITESIKKCGNSVSPPHARALVAANMPWAMTDEARERYEERRAA